MRSAKPATINEMFIWLGLYLVVLLAVVAVVFLTPVPAPWRSLVILIPLLPGLGLVRWETRYFARLDEMLLRNQLVALAWTFGITGMLMAAYILLEAVGWPRPPMWIIFMAMMCIRSACSVVQALRYR